MHYIDGNKNRLVLGDGEFDNYIQIDSIDFYLEYLRPGFPKSSYSPNSNIFRLVDPNDDIPPAVIKFCRVPYANGIGQPNKIQKRFLREIEALEKVKSSLTNNHVIEIFSSGVYQISGRNFHYYTMEAGTSDLSEFPFSEEILLNERFRICSEIIKAIETLHNNGIYHRDIKPKNFLLVGDVLKICDLGLADFRSQDFETLDKNKERIGPRGFMSPEAINRYLSNLEIVPKIDNKSDVFQLAKVIGFVLQDEILAGVIEKEDLLKSDDTGKLHKIISKAMQYSQSRRYDIHQLQSEFTSSFGELHVFS